jgi:DNA repair protein RecN (Recombination protein N)
MLDELDIRNIAIIDHLHLRFQAGLTVLTGETGAGKSIIIDALGILLGGRAGVDLIREGETQARVEGVFEAPDDIMFSATLAEFGLEGEDATLILARELSRTGRNTARVNGRAVPLSVLQRVSERLVDIHGQTEHLALLRASDQLAILDRFAGLGARREQMAALVRKLRGLRAAIARLSGDQREAARRLDLLRFQVEEIDRAALSVEEEATVAAEIQILAGAEKLRQLAGQLHAVLAGGDDTTSAEDILGSAVHLAAEIVRIDPTQDERTGGLAAVLGDVQEIAREIRRYADAVEEDPQRLAALLERQELIRTLKRKYGATVEEVLAFRAEAAREAATISHSDERRAELADEEEQAARAAGTLAGALSAARCQAAVQLAERVQQELASLNMGGAAFQVRLSRRHDAEGLAIEPSSGPSVAPAQSGTEDQTSPFAFDLTGIDQVEFLVAPNVGESPKPVARIASGGETSRIMLALKSALSEADQTATLVFDEVDVGVGGRSGRVIGEKLWQLAKHHQLLCITHLPQVAVFGDHHQKISKAVQGGRTSTAVDPLDEAGRIEELAQMVGGIAVSVTARRAAQDLLTQAQQWKAMADHG